MMNESTDRSRFSRFRRTKLGIVAQIALVVAVFLLGLTLGGGDPEPPTEGINEHEHAAEAAAESEMWTCSMHPQIQLPKPGKCPICFMDLIPVETGGGSEGLDPNQIKLSETARQLAKIETTPVRRAYAEAEVRMVGRLEYDETSVEYITAWVPGRIDTLYADFTGITVRKGEPLVSLYSPELLSAQQELLQAKKALTAMEKSSGVLRSTARSTVDAAREKLRLWGLTDQQIERIESSGAPTDHLTLPAPVGGVVIEKNAKEGQYVQTGTRIYTVADLSKLWVVLEAYESDLPWLSQGQQISFTSPSFPGETFTATISFIDPVINQQSRTARIRATVDNEAGRLKPDMFVSGIIHSQLDTEGRILPPDERPADDQTPLLIPASAPLLTGKRAVVYVQVSSDDGPIFEGREIHLGPRAGDFYVVAEGLSEGEQVVSRGAFKIDAELQIQAKPSMMSRARPAADDQPEPGRETGVILLTGVSETTREALTPLYDAYFTAQMALANDNLDEAREAMTEMLQKTKAVHMSLFEGEAHNRWMDLSQRLQAAAQIGADAADIESVRTAFRDLSNAAIELHQSFGHAEDADFYLAYCPMAFDNTGAYWLQEETIIWNSYWGETMLRCGEIRDTLPAASAPAAATPAPQQGHVH